MGTCTFVLEVDVYKHLVIRKQRSFEEVCSLVRDAQADGKRVAFTSGCFDIFHFGHVIFLLQCKESADLLIVGVDDNQTVRAAKGVDHPYFDETLRLKVLDAIEAVDFLFCFRGPCSVELLNQLKPDVYCFSKFDPKAKQKAAEARKTGITPIRTRMPLNLASSSKAGRHIVLQFMIEPWSNDSR